MKKIFLLILLLLVFFYFSSCSLIQILFLDASANCYQNYKNAFISSYGSYFLNTSGGNVVSSYAYDNRVYVAMIDSSGKLQIYVLTDREDEESDEDSINVDLLDLYNPNLSSYDLFIYETGIVHDEVYYIEGFKPILKVEKNTLYLYTLKKELSQIKLHKVTFSLDYDVSSTEKGWYCEQTDDQYLADFTSNGVYQNFILYDFAVKIACVEPGLDNLSFVLFLYDLQTKTSSSITISLPVNFFVQNTTSSFYLNYSCIEDGQGNIYIALVSYNIDSSDYFLVYKINEKNLTNTLLYNSYSDSLKVPSDYLFPGIFFYKESSTNQGPYFCWNYLDPVTNDSTFAISKIENNERIDIYEKAYDNDNYMHYISVKQESFQGIFTSRILLALDIYDNITTTDICHIGLFDMKGFSFDEVLNFSASASANCYDIPEIVNCDGFSFIQTHYDLPLYNIGYYYYKFRN